VANSFETFISMLASGSQDKEELQKGCQNFLALSLKSRTIEGGKDTRFEYLSSMQTVAWHNNKVKTGTQLPRANNGQ
jgi:hypothetical protein